MDLYLALAALVVYLLFAIHITSPRLRIAFVMVLFVLAVGNVIVGVIQFLKGHDSIPLTFLPRGEYGFRASGLYGCPNHLAGFLEVVMLFALGLTCWSRWRMGPRILAAYIAVVCAAGILMTGSRGGYASALVGVLVFSVVSLSIAGKWLRRDRWYLLFAGALALMVALGFSVRSVFRDSQLLQFRLESASVDAHVRIGMWKAAIQQFKLSPIFGTGSGTYLFYGRQFRHPHNQQDPIYAHNDYLQLLAEFGLVGAAGVFLFVGAHLRSGSRSVAAVIAERAASRPPVPQPPRGHSRKRASSAWRAVEGEEAVRQEQVIPAFKGSHTLALTIGALASIAAFAVHSFVDFNLHIPANALVMAFVFGLLANSGSGHSQNFQNEIEIGGRWNRYLRLALPAFGIFLAVTALPTWPAEYYGEKARRVFSHHEVMSSPELAHRAELFATEALRRDPKNPESYYWLGESQVTLAEMSNDDAERDRLYLNSVAAYRKALEIMPQDVRMVLCLAWSLDFLKRFDEAELVLRRALELDPNSIKVHNSYADHRRREGLASDDKAVYKRKFAEAEAAYYHSASLAPQPAADYGLRQLEKDRKAKEEEERRKEERGKGAEDASSHPRPPSDSTDE